MYLVCCCISVVKGCSVRLVVTTYIDLFEVVHRSLDLILSWVHTAVECLSFFNPLFIFQNDIGELQEELWQKIIGHIVYVVVQFIVLSLA